MFKAIRLLLIVLFILLNLPSFAFYEHMKEDMPKLRAILCKSGSSVALGTLNGNRFFIKDGDILCNEWKVEEIRRKSVLFRRVSNKTFAEIFLNCDRPVRRTRDITFIAVDIELFEALQMVAMVFDMQILMSCECVRAAQKMNFAMQPKNIEELIRKLTIHDHNRAYIEDGSIYVVPEGLRFSMYADVEHLEGIYPGLAEKGYLVAEGEDIQSVMRRFSNGSGITVMFDKNLHFPVYAALNNVKFSVMLEKIICMNNCALIEYENGIEIAK